MIHQYRYLFVKMKVFNYSELHFFEGTFYKIHTLIRNLNQWTKVRSQGAHYESTFFSPLSNRITNWDGNAQTLTLTLLKTNSRKTMNNMKLPSNFFSTNLSAASNLLQRRSVFQALLGMDLWHLDARFTEESTKLLKCWKN